MRACSRRACYVRRETTVYFKSQITGSVTVKQVRMHFVDMPSHSGKLDLRRDGNRAVTLLVLRTSITGGRQSTPLTLNHLLPC